MATKKVDVEIDVNSNVKESIQGLKDLKKELRNAAAGSDEFKRISADIRDVEDAIAGATKGADDFAGAMEAAPGPVGNLARGIKQVEIATKSWGAALKATGIGLIVALVAGLVGAFREQEDMMKRLEPVMIGFERIMNGIFSVVEPLLNTFIELATKALPYFSDAVGIVYSTLSGFFSLVKDVGLGVGTLLKGIFTFDYDAVKEGWDLLKNAIPNTIEAVKSSLVSYEAGSRRLTNTERTNAEARNKIREDETAALAAELKERERIQTEAEKTVNDVRLSLQTEYRQKLAAINEEFAKDAQAVRDSVYVSDEKTAADVAAIIEKRTRAGEVIRNEYFAELNTMLDASLSVYKDTAEYEISIERDKQKEILNILIDGVADGLLTQEEANHFALLAEQRFTVEKENITAKHNAKELAAEEELLNQKRALNQSYADSAITLAGMVQNSGELLGERNRKLGKRVASAGVVVESAASIFKLLSQYNQTAGAIRLKYALVPGGQVLANAEILASKISTGVNIAAVTAQAGIALRNINKSDSGTSVSSGTGGLTSPTQGTSPTQRLIPQRETPQFAVSGGSNPSQQIADTLAGITKKPIRAYVVSGDVSSQQALDRRTSRAATFT
jgi:hypothetical protein